MMKICLIEPFNYIGVFKTSDMVLALNQLTNSYPFYFHTIKNHYKYVILDNGANEQSNSTTETFFKMFETCVKHKFQEIQFPDIQFNMKDTMDMWKAIFEQEPEIPGLLWKYNIKPQFVLQINKIEDISKYLFFISVYVTSDFFSNVVLGIPYKLELISHIPRINIVNEILDCGIKPEQIHLLGWNSIKDLEIPARSIDTTQPIKLGIDGIDMKHSVADIPRQKNYFDVQNLSRSQIDMIRANIGFINFKNNIINEKEAI